MFDWIGRIFSGIGEEIGADVPFSSRPLRSIVRQVVQIFGPPPQDPVDNPAGPTVEQIIQERNFRGVGVDLPTNFEQPQTGIEYLGDPFDPGEATFEPDPLAIPDPGTAAEAVTPEEPPEPQETMPIHLRIGAALAPLFTGTAFGVGGVVGSMIGEEVFGIGDGSGTSVAPPEPATTPGIGGANGVNGVSPAHCGGTGRVTIAQIRGQILRKIGARHGRCSFSYNVARRILRDLGEGPGAVCLGISAEEACFLLIHPPKRRGRQITPKQINRAMGAYNRVRALNKRVRKTLGPGCKL